MARHSPLNVFQVVAQNVTLKREVSRVAEITLKWATVETDLGVFVHFTLSERLLCIPFYNHYR